MYSFYPCVARLCGFLASRKKNLGFQVKAVGSSFLSEEQKHDVVRHHRRCRDKFMTCLENARRSRAASPPLVGRGRCCPAQNTAIKGELNILGQVINAD